MLKYFRLSGMLRTRLEDAGVSVPDVLIRARLPRDLFDRTRVMLTTDEVFSLFRAIEDESGDPAIGLILGTETKLERFHPVGIAAMSAETFGAAVNDLARFKRLSAPEEIIQDHGPVEWTIHFRYLLAPEAEPPILVDQVFAWILTIARRGTGTQISPLRIELLQPRKNLRILEKHFGCPIRTGAARNAIIFRASDTSCRFITRNPELLNIIGAYLDRELAVQQSEDSFIELIRGAIQQRLKGARPTVRMVAQDLRLTPRTVQRKLQNAGTNFQQLLDQTRRQMARYYLRNSLLELAEAAYLLGYEDAASFARAFRGWEGVPPSTWRDANSPVVAN